MPWQATISPSHPGRSCGSRVTAMPSRVLTCGSACVSSPLPPPPPPPGCGGVSPGLLRRCPHPPSCRRLHPQLPSAPGSHHCCVLSCLCSPRHGRRMDGGSTAVEGSHAHSSWGVGGNGNHVRGVAGVWHCRNMRCKA